MRFAWDGVDEAAGCRILAGHRISPAHVHLLFVNGFIAEEFDLASDRCSQLAGAIQESVRAGMMDADDKVLDHGYHILCLQEQHRQFFRCLRAVPGLAANSDAGQRSRSALAHRERIN